MTGVNITAKLTQEQRQWLFERDNIIYWQAGNVIIPCLGRTANTAIKAAILHAEGGVDPFYNLHADPRIIYVDRAFMARTLHVPVIGVLRDPYDRVVSFWRDKVAPRTEETFTAGYLPGVRPGMPFMDFILAFIRILSGKTAITDMNQLGDLRHAGDLFNYEGSLRITRLFRFETIITQTGWNEFRSFTARMYDLPASLPKLNAPRHPAPLLVPSDEQFARDAIRIYYRADYMLYEGLAR